jgi:hypothetical protein
VGCGVGGVWVCEHKFLFVLLGGKDMCVAW